MNGSLRLDVARPSARFLARPIGVTLAVGTAWWLAATIHPHDTIHEIALFAHLACLTVGFGAVLSVDWVAVLWLLKRRGFADVLIAAGNAHGLIWVGYAGLVASGILLEPDVSSALTITKLVLVLVIGLNGAAAMALHEVLESNPGSAPDGLLLVVTMAAGGISQASWWGATTIGFLNAR